MSVNFLGSMRESDRCQWNTCRGSIKMMVVKFDSGFYGRESWKVWWIK